MSKVSHDRFLYYYNQELSYLRHSGKNFAKTYPKVARRLELSDSESPDPHVERLIESFAFLTGRLSKEIDDQYPETASALLNILFPHLVNPIPAMGIAHLQCDPSKGNLTTGFTVPKGTLLNAQAQEGISCQFTTVYPTKVWPIQLNEVRITSFNKYIMPNGTKADWAIGFYLKSMNVDFKEMGLDSLDFHIRAERKLALLIYQIIFAQKEISLFYSIDGKTLHALPKNSIIPLGFDHDHLSLPMGTHAIHSYQLLQDYFHLPEKFLFFRIQNLEFMRHFSPDDLQLFISIEEAGQIYEENLSPDNFLLGTTPIVNLFPKTTDPFRLDKRQTHYRLVTDQRLDKVTEVYSIEEIIGTIEGQGEPVELSQYFSFNHHTTINPDTVYWTHKRVSSSIRDLPGTDIYLSFVDMNFTPQMPAQQIIYAKTLCTNRYLPEQLPYNAILEPESALPVSQIVCLDKPTAQVHAPDDGETLWELISQLSVNYLGVGSGTQSINNIKEMLRLYVGKSSHGLYDIEMLQDIEVNPITRRVSNEAWRGFVRGHEVVLIIDNRTSSGSSAFLLASVLRYYFSLHVGINSFIEVVLKYDKSAKEVMRWQPIPGMQIQL